MSSTPNKPSSQPKDTDGVESAGFGDAETPNMLARMSRTDKEEIAKRVIDHIERHARAHGSFSGLADFISRCDQVIAETRAKRGKLAVTLANSLARDVSSLREVTDALTPEMKASVYRGITTGFLFANLKHEISDGKDRRGERFSREEYFDALAKNPKSRVQLAESLNITLPRLVKWERKYLR